MSARGIALGAALALLLGASPASAAIFHAADGGGSAPGCAAATPCSLLQAVAQADADTTRDSLVIDGPLAHTVSTVDDTIDLSQSPIDLVGSGQGPGGTVVDGAQTPLIAVGPDSSVSNLRVVPDQLVAIQVLQGGDVSDITGVLGTSDTAGIEVDDAPGTGTTEIDRVTLTGADHNSSGIFISPSTGTVHLRDSSIDVAGPGVEEGGNSFSDSDEKLIVERSTVTASTDAIRVFHSDAEIWSSLVRLRPGGTDAVHVLTDDFHGGPATATLHQMTVDGAGGAAGAEGVSVQRGLGGSPASVTLAGTVARDFATDVACHPRDGTDPPDPQASAVLLDSNYETQSGCDSSGWTGVVGGATGFVNPAAGDFSLASSSPLIDRGGAGAATPAEPGTDLAGSARIVDGNGDGVAARDIGAYEYQPPAQPTPAGGPPAQTGPVVARDLLAPTVSSLSLSRRRFRVGAARTPVSARRVPAGTRLRFRLSEPASVSITIQRRGAGRRSKGRCRAPSKRLRRARPCTRWLRAGTLKRRGRAGTNSIPFSGRIGRRALRPGSYRAVIRATDAAGNRSAPRTAGFRIVRSTR